MKTSHIRNTPFLLLVIVLSLLSQQAQTLIITSPASIAGTYEAVRTTFSGPLPPPSSLLNAEVVLSNPIFVCDPYLQESDPSSIAGKIVIVYVESSCLPWSTVVAIENAGGAAAILIRDELDPTLDDYDQNTYSNIYAGEMPSVIAAPILAALTNGENVTGQMFLAQTVPAQQSALLDFFAATQGSGWVRGLPGWDESWVSTTDACAWWFGVNCNEQGEVTHLLLDENNLIGTFPTSFGQLTSMIMISMGRNALSGTLPTGISDFLSLRTVQLGYNSIKGEALSLFLQSPKLERLYLNNNYLTGTLPNALPPLLSELGIGSNLFAGTIPEQLGFIPALSYLSFTGNSFTGTIPDFSALVNLTTLDLSHNQLSGFIPSTIGGLESVTLLDLSYNQLTGEIPHAIGGLASVRTLTLSHNQLSGEVPGNISILANLLQLDLSYNLYTGEVPALYPTSLKYLYLKGNGFTDVSPMFSTLVHLALVDLSYNKLWNDLSWYYMPFVYPNNILEGDFGLVTLDLSYNQISMVSAPDFELYLDYLPAITSLSLAHNLLNGTLYVNPVEQGFITNIDFSDNLLIGTIPEAFSQWTTMKVLDLSNNFFHHGQGSLLPSFFVVNEKSRTVNDTANFDCPTFTSNFPVSIIIDNSYHDFQLCHCLDNYRRADSFLSTSDYLNNTDAEGVQLQCISCPAHMVCPGGFNDTAFLFESGYYPTPSPEHPEYMLECENCDNPNNVFGCADGHQGRLCAQCMPGYFAHGSKCAVCSPFGILLMAAAVVLFVGVLFFFALAFKKCGYMSKVVPADNDDVQAFDEHDLEKPTTPMKAKMLDFVKDWYEDFLHIRSLAIISIIINYYQTLSILNTGIPFTITLKVLISIIEFSNVTGLGFGIECVDYFFVEYWPRYLSVALQPLIVVALIAVVFVIGYTSLKLMHLKDIHWWKHMCGRSLLFLLNFLYFPVIITTIAVFKCEDDPATLISYLSQQPFATCDSIPVGVKILFALINIASIFMGFAAVVYIYKNTTSNATTHAIQRYFGFFFLHFRRDQVYTSLYMMGRRLLFSLVNGLLPAGSLLLFSLNELILGVSIVIVFIKQPYQRSIDNRLEIISFIVLFVSYALITVGSLTQSLDSFAPTPDENAGFGLAEAVFIGINAILAIWFIIVFIPSKIISIFKVIGPRTSLLSMGRVRSIMSTRNASSWRAF